jgi:DNA repair protein RecN (Recombination protein N)
MLKELHVKNFAIIDDVKISFGRGLNILSGETGAGKTLIIEAINLLIGERADSGLIRDGKDKLLVQGFFDFSENANARDYLLENNILDSGDFENDIVISRELNRTGKNKAFINGLFTQVSILKGLGNCFLDIHGQHDHQYLLDAKTHINILDNSSPDAIGPLKEEYSGKYHEYHIQKKKLDSLINMQENRDARLQDLKFRYDEIDRLKILENEEEDLENELSILKNFESIYRLASETEERIKGDNSEKSGLSEDISIIQADMEKLAAIDSRFKDFSERVESLSGILEELGHFIGSYLTDFDFSRERLDAIQERLYSFSLIKKKYNIDTSQAGKYLEKISQEIDGFESLDTDIEKCTSSVKASFNSLCGSAENLHNERKSTASILEKKITSELKDLGFSSIDFQIRIEKAEVIPGNFQDDSLFNKSGIDGAEFYISLNAGECPRPLKKVASGGEVSRVMLALKSALGEADNISTMVFDEIDSGVGGAISLIVGEKLFRISRKKQVIVISHLAQIACFSNSHYFIDKYVEDERTKIKIDELDNSGKVKEISRMLGGSRDSQISLNHAEELIGEANQVKERLEKEILSVGN